MGSAGRIGPGLRRPSYSAEYVTHALSPLPLASDRCVSQVCVFLLSMAIKAAPAQALAAVGFILAGVPVYYMTQREEYSSPAAGIVGASLDVLLYDFVFTSVYLQPL